MNLLLHGRLLGVCLIASCLVGEPAMAQVHTPSHAAAAAKHHPASPAPAVPEGYVVLIRTTLVALNQANLTGNYAVLYGLLAPQFQKEKDINSFSQAFANFRDLKIDLSPVTVIAPQLLQPAGFDAQGNLHLSGLFPTQPLQVRFNLAYQNIDGHWLATAIAVNAVPVPQAQVQPSSSAAKTAPRAAKSPVVRNTTAPASPAKQ